MRRNPIHRGAACERMTLGERERLLEMLDGLVVPERARRGLSGEQAIPDRARPVASRGEVRRQRDGYGRCITVVDPLECDSGYAVQVRTLDLIELPVQVVLHEVVPESIACQQAASHVLHADGGHQSQLLL